MYPDWNYMKLLPMVFFGFLFSLQFVFIKAMQNKEIENNITMIENLIEMDQLWNKNFFLQHGTICSFGHDNAITMVPKIDRNSNRKNYYFCNRTGSGVVVSHHVFDGECHIIVSWLDNEQKELERVLNFTLCKTGLYSMLKDPNAGVLLYHQSFVEK